MVWQSLAPCGFDDVTGYLVEELLVRRPLELHQLEETVLLVVIAHVTQAVSLLVRL